MELSKYTIYNGYVTGYGCRMVNRKQIERELNVIWAEPMFRYSFAPSGGGGGKPALPVGLGGVYDKHKHQYIFACCAKFA